MIAEMLTVLENTWFGLRLDRYRLHPIHNGWRMVFKRWLNAGAVKNEWERLKPEFSYVFQSAVEEIMNGQKGTE